jgi:hypothetical protein
MKAYRGGGANMFNFDIVGHPVSIVIRYVSFSAVLHTAIKRKSPYRDMKFDNPAHGQTRYRRPISTLFPHHIW